MCENFCDEESVGEEEGEGSEEEVEGEGGEEIQVGEGGDDEDFERESPPAISRPEKLILTRRNKKKIVLSVFRKEILL
jgi:hypothetical protein